MTPAVCAAPGCDRPAVAVVTTTQARIQIRTDRLDNPRTAAAWTHWLRCWACTSAAVDQHLVNAPARHETKDSL
ncbi:hypothetical protein [Micromonospora carbonacea]|uniref:Uncharacterized protein n=1 Tax=Micromonospora carbonacea TaxID=47853 RepID=A0A1C5AYU6_9ACTN|nr:hypothetical protein [Micromonospora carbonacea]SCF50399.1 hypothetical protein GA0070563_13124 [Micromonospora carbonacea]